MTSGMRICGCRPGYDPGKHRTAVARTLLLEGVVMSLSAKLRRAPGRITTGAFILNTGIDNLRNKDDEKAKGVHGMVAGAYPVFEKVEPKVFLKALGAGEVILGGALLLPVAPAALVGLGLAGYAGGLLGVYWRTPSMHRDATDPRPTQQGTPVAKDVWLFGIGTGLVIDAILSGAGRRSASAKGAIKGATAAAMTSAGAAAAETSAAAGVAARSSARSMRRSARSMRRSAKSARHAAAVQAKSGSELAAVKARDAAEIAVAKMKPVAEVAAARAKDAAEITAAKAKEAATVAGVKAQQVAHETAHSVKERIA